MLGSAAGIVLTLALCGCHPTVTQAAPNLPQKVTASVVSPASAPAAVAQGTAVHPEFDAQGAFKVLKDQVAFGPRYLGIDAHQKCLEYLQNKMRRYADETVLQKFAYRGLPVTNVVGVFYPAGTHAPSVRPILLMAHWDTRPIADGPNSTEMEKGPYRYSRTGWNRLSPIPGANDGASGVAVLLELARLFKQKPPPVGVILLLDDGEDYGDFRAAQGGEGVELGARYFAEHFHDEPHFGKPAYGILLDMVGGKNMKILPERYSQRVAPGTNERVFGTARSLGYERIFSQSSDQEVGDDHLQINQLGHIPTIDLIQPLPFPGSGPEAYAPWHTLQDDVAHCEPQSLKAVGDTIAEVIYEETPEP